MLLHLCYLNIFEKPLAKLVSERKTTLCVHPTLLVRMMFLHAVPDYHQNTTAVHE